MNGVQFKVCPRCGGACHLQAPQCHQCGHLFTTPFNQTQGYYSQPPFGNPYGYPAPVPGMIQVPPGTHPVWVVVLVSILGGGWLGMVINKQVAKGLLFGLLGGIFFTVITCGYGVLLWYPLVLIDSILIATKLNSGRPVRDWEFF